MSLAAAQARHYSIQWIYSHCQGVLNNTQADSGPLHRMSLKMGLEIRPKSHRKYCHSLQCI